MHFASYAEGGGSHAGKVGRGLRERQPKCLLLRRGLPLLAASALLGPSAALAAGPRPDTPPPAPPPVSNLSPDPAPGAATTDSAHARRPTTVVAPAAATPTFRTTTPASRPAATERKKPKAAPARRAAHKATPSAVRIVDVPPLHVDVPVGLGAVAAEVRDDSSAILGAIALLAAACAAASGIALTVVAGREGAAA